MFRIINRSRKLVFEDVGAIQTRQSPHPWSNISSLNSSQETPPRPPLRRAYTRTDNAGEAIPFSSRRRRRFYFLFEVFRFLCPWRRPVRSFSSAWTKQASAISSSTTRAATRAGRWSFFSCSVRASSSRVFCVFFFFFLFSSLWWSIF